MVEVDKGYRGEPYYARTPEDYVSCADQGAKEMVRTRHETRFKQWGALQQVFRHPRSKHKQVFAAVAVITQLSFEQEAGPFQCKC